MLMNGPNKCREFLNYVPHLKHEKRCISLMVHSFAETLPHHFVISADLHGKVDTSTRSLFFFMTSCRGNMRFKTSIIHGNLCLQTEYSFPIEVCVRHLAL